MLIVTKPIQPITILGDTCDELQVQVTQIKANEKAFLLINLLGNKNDNRQVIHSKSEVMEGADYTSWTADDYTPFNYAANLLNLTVIDE